MSKIRLLLISILIIAFCFILVSCSSNNETKETNVTTNPNVETVKNKVTITLNSNGGSVPYASLLVDYGDSATLPTPEKTGASFLGWYNEKGELVDANHKYTNSEVLTAKWSMYSVTFYDLKGDIFYISQVNANGKVNIPDKTPEPYNGMTFTSWDFDFNKSIVNDEIVYPKYEVVVCRVTLDPNGGSVENKELGFRVNSQINLPTPTKTGKTFVGWFDENDNKIENGTLVKNDMNLVAKWNRYDVYFLGSNNDVFSITTVASGEKLTIPEGHPKGKDCHAFEKWNFDFDKPVNCDYFIQPIFSQDEFEHDFNDWVTVYTADYDSKGLEARICKNCEFVESVELPMKDDLIFTLISDVEENYYSVGGNIKKINELELSKIVIPDTYKGLKVKNIDYEGFAGVQIIKEVVLGNNIVEIGSYAFYKSGIEKITWSSKVEIIGVSAFENTQLEKIEIPNSIKVISNSAFARNEKVTEIVINDMKGEIKESAFAYCSSTKIIRLHKNIKKIYAQAFEGIDGLESIYFYGSEADFEKMNIVPDGNESLVWELKTYV